MLVAITGGTGFVGSFTVAAVLAQGHDVRLLVRSPDKVAPVMKLQGLDPDAVEVVVADLTDRAAIRRGLEGCDAVINVASVFTFDPSRAEDIERTNREGVDAVLGQAAELGLDPIVHVSSIVALYHGERRVDMGPDVPPGESRYPYSGSKAVQERAARALQDTGQPVVIVYPGAVWGPNDPYDGESTQFARAAMSGLFVTVPQGYLAVCDVRDVAQVLARTIEPGRGPRRYSAAGHVVPLSEMVRRFTSLAGKPRRSFALPDPAMRMTEAMLWQLNSRGRGARLPLSAEQIWLGRKSLVADNSRTEDELGVTFRPTDETFADQAAWMHETRPV